MTGGFRGLCGSRCHPNFGATEAASILEFYFSQLTGWWRLGDRGGQHPEYGETQAEHRHGYCYGHEDLEQEHPASLGEVRKLSRVFFPGSVGADREAITGLEKFHGDRYRR